MPKYLFQDIIQNVNEKKAGIPGDEKNFISMKHILPRNLSISSWGLREPFSDEKLIVKKGDVLFIAREPQNHQVAICPIDGLFTGYGMVFRPKKEVILPEFLPYFIFSDIFIQAVSAFSVGTKTKTINWSELKNMEFDLPDLTHQKKIMEIIDKYNTLTGSYQALKTDLIQAKDRFYYDQVLQNQSAASLSLGELMTLRTKREKLTSLSTNYISYEEILKKALPDSTPNNTNYFFRIYENQLLSTRPTFSKGGFLLVPRRYHNCLVSGQSVIFEIHSNLVSPQFLYEQLTDPTFLDSISDIDFSSENWNLILSKKQLLIPSIKEQEKYLKFILQIKKSLEHTETCISQTYDALQSLLCENIRFCR